jgi:antitoxin component of MazEF toxin-antitoxin module
MGNSVSASAIAQIEDRYASNKQVLLDSAMTAQIQSNKELINGLENVSSLLTPEVIDALSKLPNPTVVELIKYYNAYLGDFKTQVTGIADEIIKATRPIVELTSPEAVLQSLSPQARADVKKQLHQQTQELRKQKQKQKATLLDNAGKMAIENRQAAIDDLQKTVGKIKQDVRQNGDAVDLHLAASTVESAGQLVKDAQQQARKAAATGNTSQMQASTKQATLAAGTAQQVVDALTPVIPPPVVAPMASATKKMQRSIQQQQQQQH